MNEGNGGFHVRAQAITRRSHISAFLIDDRARCLSGIRTGGGVYRYTETCRVPDTDSNADTDTDTDVSAAVGIRVTAVGEGFLPQYEGEVGGPMAWLIDRSGGEGRAVRAVSYAVGWGVNALIWYVHQGSCEECRECGECGRCEERERECREEMAEQNRSIQLYRVYTGRCTATHGDIQHQHPIGPSNWAVM